MPDTGPPYPPDSPDAKTAEDVAHAFSAVSNEASIAWKKIYAWLASWYGYQTSYESERFRLYVIRLIMTCFIWAMAAVAWTLLTISFAVFIHEVTQLNSLAFFAAFGQQALGMAVLWRMKSLARL